MLRLGVRDHVPVEGARAPHPAGTLDPYTEMVVEAWNGLFEFYHPSRASFHYVGPVPSSSRRQTLELKQTLNDDLGALRASGRRCYEALRELRAKLDRRA